MKRYRNVDVDLGEGLYSNLYATDSADEGEALSAASAVEQAEEA